ncbi:hypothetical protein DENIS_2543 [Desulfonema ishimotonii]|uniref:Sensor domain-containing diguanylate cyclase n=1 Tax=Desulfonema ishimotonii TaxID=45657 RepID=A0A401FX95_9BACT|nr:diguanylate cyclase [Desulfonema ishimotonii]GBC61581.1 hypothetical protein DENIS_2543 [Desulfonema ishimotonii]
MFLSVLFRRIFISNGMIALGLAVMICLLCVPAVSRILRSQEEQRIRTSLSHICNAITTLHEGLRHCRGAAVAARKQQIRNAVLARTALFANTYRAFQQGEFPSGEAARASALAALDTFEDDYEAMLWVADYDGAFIVPPESDLLKKHLLNAGDEEGRPAFPAMIRLALDKNEGYVRYRHQKSGGSQPVDMTGYSKNFHPWHWIIGAVFSLSDIEKILSQREQNALRQLRDTLPAEDGNLLVFNSRMDSILPPATPGTGGPAPDDARQVLLKKLMAAAHTPARRIRYHRNHPNDPDHDTFEKTAWVRHIPDRDWYVVLSVYTDDLDRPAQALRKQFLVFFFLTFLIYVIAITGVLTIILTPVTCLSDMAAEFLRKGEIRENRYLVDHGEIGTIGAAIFGMTKQLDSCRQKLGQYTRDREHLIRKNDRVRERAYELTRARKKLEKDLENYKHIHADLKKSEERYRAMLENIEEYFYEVDLLGNLIFFNDALYQMLGYTREELLGMNFREYMDPETSEKAYHTFKKAYDSGKPYRGFEWRLVRKDGTRCYVEVSVALIRDENDEVIGFRGIARDISELIYLVYHDSLTGLYNRQAFFERLKETLAYAKRDKNEKNIFYLDLDNFKQVNDDYGHDVGDEVLKEVSARLRESLRETDHICRLGGDEFTIILNNISDSRPDEAACRIIESLSEPYVIHGFIIDFITPSIGISAYPRDAQDIERLIKCADIAMYKAKETGGKYTFYDKSLEPDSEYEG